MGKRERMAEPSRPRYRLRVDAKDFAGQRVLFVYFILLFCAKIDAIELDEFDAVDVVHVQGSGQIAGDVVILCAFYTVVYLVKDNDICCAQLLQLFRYKGEIFRLQGLILSRRRHETRRIG